MAAVANCAELPVSVDIIYTADVGEMGGIGVSGLE